MNHEREQCARGSSAVRCGRLRLIASDGMRPLSNVRPHLSVFAIAPFASLCPREHVMKLGIGRGLGIKLG